MTGNRSKLKNFVEKFIGIVKFGNDHFGAIMGYGDYVIGDSVISRVYYVEGLGHNLFSCFVRDINGADLLKGSRRTNLYTISIDDMMKSSPLRDHLKMEMEMEIPSVKASANSDIIFFFTSAQDGNKLLDDERLSLADDLKKIQEKIYERSHKGVKASANSDIIFFFTSAQDGNKLLDDERLSLADDLKKAHDQNQNKVEECLALDDLVASINSHAISNTPRNYDILTRPKRVINMACEEGNSQEVLGFSDVIAKWKSILLLWDPMFRPLLRSQYIGDNDFLLEEVDVFLALEDDPTSPEV
ncbi:hypothetical protein Tco_1571402 [Tanacetum coccineum]